MRADIFLYEKGFAKSRNHAAALIKSGVFLNGKKIAKAAEHIPDDVTIESIQIEDPLRYVSRGGLKLEAALSAFSLDVTGKTAIDLGASTGGFTDCLLQHGASRVFAVDVGHDQLDATLRLDPRVICMEGLNARTLTQEHFGGVPADLAVSDLSFISQSLVYPAVARTVRHGGTFISLIKPQFEAGKAAVRRGGGIVRDRTIHIDVIENLFQAAESILLYPEALAVSPITGGDGNREYLALFRIGEKQTESPKNIHDIVLSQ